MPGGGAGRGLNVGRAPDLCRAGARRRAGDLRPAVVSGEGPPLDYDGSGYHAGGRFSTKLASPSAASVERRLAA